MRQFLILFAAFLLVSCNIQKEEVDLILHNGSIHTLDPSSSVAQAIAIKDGRIIELGPERAILNRYKAAEVIDLKLRPVYPGFIDAHCHFLAYGRGQAELDLTGTTSWEEILKRLAQLNKPEAGQWIKGQGWDQNDWELQSFPSKLALDSMFPNNPVLLTRIDGHAIIVNQAALDLAGIDANSSVEGGQVVLENGAPSGILIDKAMNLIDDHLARAAFEQDREALLKAQSDCFQVGLTTVSDAGLMKSDLETIQELYAQGDLKMRMYVMLSDVQENIDYYLPRGPIKTDQLSVCSFKFYADGALGSRGACLFKPYSDLPNHTGFLLDSLSHFRQRAQEMYDAGFQMNTHCIGDSANHEILAIYASILEPSNDRRWRIEHAQVLRKEDRQFFSAFNIIPSVQPTHATSDMPWAELRLGRNRMRRAYAYQSLKQELGLLALGTDFPVEGINPLSTFYAAVSRTDSKGQPQGGFIPEEKLTREEALRGMTIWAAVANFEEENKGSLEEGKLADLVVLDRDLLTCADSLILKTEVDFTILGGEVVYRK